LLPKEAFTAMSSTTTGLTLQQQFERDGFAAAPQLVDAAYVGRAVEHMDSVLETRYETGMEPYARRWNPGEDDVKLRKIDQPQYCDLAIRELVADPAIGHAAAELTGAETVQVWGVQLLYKPPGGAATGSVGWHQDQQYWLRWWTPDSEVFTCWLALSDVTPDAGPMRFVPGSHRWGLVGKPGEIGGGDFYATDTDRQREEIPVPPGEAWSEVEGILSPGEATFHHRLTYHGSGPNVSSGPRRSFAIHLRTQNSEVADLGRISRKEAEYLDYLDDPAISPVIYRRA
jgi:ectoine hydroxylase-related dioxygenase (phytanoyl-CoA dioxygenase family)